MMGWFTVDMWSEQEKILWDLEDICYDSFNLAYPDWYKHIYI